MNEADLWAYLEDHPRSYEAHMELGTILFRTGRARLAIHSAVMAREIGWDHRAPWLLLGQCYIDHEVDRPHDAEPCLRKALSMGRDAEVVTMLAECLYQTGRLDEARELFAESISYGHSYWVIEQWARLELDARDPQAALDVLAKSEWDKKRTLDSMILETEIRLSMGASKLQVLAALRLIPDERLSQRALSAKGRLYDKLECYEDAWECWTDGKVGAHPYDHADSQRRIDTRRDIFSRIELPRAGKADGGQPIFIVGAARSGTTLVEQMLSQHPDIEAGGELKLMPDMIYLLPKFMDLDGEYPEILPKLSVGDMNHLRDAYLAEASRRGLRKKAWFTDKQLMNLYDIPFIHALFPSSAVFYIIRHPLDVVVSQFSQQLTHGQWCAATPEDAATHFKISHEKVPMALWRYEDIVNDPWRLTQDMSIIIGVEHNYAMAEPETNPHIPQTASRLQVQEPIHDRSIGRWKNYRQWLGPAIEILRDTCNELGYEVDEARPA